MAADLFDLTGRTALVTGSSRGLGLTIARGLGRAGAALVLNGRDETRLAAAADALRDQGLRVSPCPFDVTDAAAIDSGLECHRRPGRAHRHPRQQRGGPAARGP